MNRELLKHSQFTLKTKDVIQPKANKEKAPAKAMASWKRELLRGAVAIIICYLFWILLKTFVVGYITMCTGGSITSIEQFTSEFSAYMAEKNR